MQHMIQKPYPSRDGYLLRGRELGGMRGISRVDDAGFGCFGGFSGRWGREMSGWFVGREDAAVEGERDLDFGFVGYACDGGCSGGHFGGSDGGRGTVRMNMEGSFEWMEVIQLN